MNQNIKVSTTADAKQKEIKTAEDFKKAIQEDFEKNFYKTIAAPDNIEAFKQTLTKRIQEYKITRGNGPDGSLYYHDCNECLFLGGFIDCDINEQSVLNVNYFDLYAHKRENRLELISRYGDSVNDYISFTLFYENGKIIHNPTIQRISSINEAFKRYLKTEVK
ncbi:MAG: hypothetical protein NC311_11400 [Muribaculaceae bacterium]|nr:hypothetical protein [Muribaculaceae bacterium]